jgi:hypothetical protein
MRLKYMDLDKLNFGLSADKFYSKSMDRENIKYTSDKQYVDTDAIFRTALPLLMLWLDRHKPTAPPF